jgi:hypothetical protein
MTDLAERAEALVGKPCGPQQQATLALHWFGLAWPVISPEVVAGSARASLLLGPPGVVMSSAPGDQCREIAERLDDLWAQAQADPAAAVVEVGPPMLELPPRDRPPEPEPDALGQTPADWLSGAEVCELLGLTLQTVSRWRDRGRFGVEGEHWGRRGRGHCYAPEVVEALMVEQASTAKG